MKTHAYRPWLRVTIFLVLFTVLYVIAGVASHMLPGGNRALLFGYLGCAAGMLTIVMVVKVYGVPWSATGTRANFRTVPGFLIGCGIGLAAFLILFTSLLVSTPLEITCDPSPPGIGVLPTLIPVFLLALMEEIGFRSYPQLTLHRAYGVWASQLSMAFIFACYHIGYGWSPALSFTGPFVWAFLYGLCAIWWNGIAVSTGCHFIINILQQVCGLQGSKPLSVWTVNYLPGTTDSMKEQTTIVGMILHMGLLMLFLIGTHLYARKERQEQLSSVDAAS